MNGVSGASSREISSADMPSKPGSVKSERMTSGLNSRSARAKHGFGVHALPGARETTGFELTDGDFRLHRHVFDENQSYRLHSCHSPRLVSAGSPCRPAQPVAPAALRRHISPAHRRSRSNLIQSPLLRRVTQSAHT